MTIDSTGINITDGALTLQDEFGKSVLGASGFVGSWTDFVRLGLYNARFQSVAVGTLGIGRTSDLPYWTTQQTTGSPVFTGLSGGGVKITFAATGDVGYLYSDKVPVVPGSRVEATATYKANYAAGSFKAIGYVYWYQADGSASSTPNNAFLNDVFATSVTSPRWTANSLTVPSDAASAVFP